MMPLTHRMLLMGGLHAQALWRHGVLQSGELGLGHPTPLEPVGKDPADEDIFVPNLLLAIFLVAMAGLMSGLTLGLMSLDQVDLEILRRSGTERQKWLAQRIHPVLRRPHVLLVTLLVCNAAAAEALPLVLDRLADPVTAILVSVTVVLLFGEIIPQAACSRYGLQIGAYSAPFVRLLMFLTAPVSLPIGWVLDRVLGHRHTALFRRAELKALMDIHKEGQEFGGQLSADEVSIIKGALDMTHKTARDAMTPIDMVFMLPADSVLDEQTLTAIMASGHSRIPVFRPGDRRAILGIMLVKELLLVDSSQGKMVGRQKVRSIPFVRADTPLYDMLKLFEIGRSHMAVLMQLRKEAAERRRKANEAVLMVNIDSMSDDPSMVSEEEEEGLLSPRRTATADDFIFDPTDFEPVGIITIEDVLEELLQAEILDETDQFVDNLQRTPINTAFLMRSLPAHLRGVLTARALLPRIGGAAFMHEVHGDGGLAAGEGGRRHAEQLLGLGQSQSLGLGLGLGLGRGPPYAALSAATKTAAETVGSSGTPAGGAEGTCCGGPAPGGSMAAGSEPGSIVTSPLKPSLPPMSPRLGAAPGSGVVSPVLGGGGIAPQRPPRQPLSARGGGLTKQPGSAGGSMHDGLLYKQGSVGAALVAEALRQEVAQQLAAAAAVGSGSGASTYGAVPRSRSRSPLPRRSSHEGATRPQAGSDGALGVVGLKQPGGGAAGQQRQQAGPLALLFPGVKRSLSDAAASSKASTPRPVVPLPPPPARRSTNVSQRVQEQMDLLQPLLTRSWCNSSRSLQDELLTGGSGSQLGTSGGSAT